MNGFSLKNLRFSAAENLEKNRKIIERDEFFRSPAFSDDGFIERQQYLSELHFGARDSAYGGCGWIAAYNLLHAAKTKTELPVLISEAERGAVLKGVLGTSPFFIRKLLARLGIVLRFFSKRSFISGRAERGFIYYVYRNFSGHFAAFTKENSEGEARYRFYNVGKPPFIVSPKEFFKAEKPIFSIIFGEERN